MNKPGAEVVVALDLSGFGQSSLHQPHFLYSLLDFSSVPHQYLFPDFIHSETEFPWQVIGKIHGLSFVVLHSSKENIEKLLKYSSTTYDVLNYSLEILLLQPRILNNMSQNHKVRTNHLRFNPSSSSKQDIGLKYRTNYFETFHQYE